MDGPRILAIMGSGETAPTMAKVHRELFGRFGEASVPAAILDTPYGFQENADDLSERTVRFFAESVGRDASVASYRSRDIDAVAAATAIARLRESRYVMAGPGSPSYALRQWTDGPIPGALTAVVRDGGVLTMASAAALTVGVVTIPVYEVYKVGADPSWLPGLDLLADLTGLRAAVIPHYDNAEGGNHDTRFCYMGERRLRTLEAMLPDGAFVLGVDSHTALLLDLGRDVASVHGLGGVTVRVDGRSTVLPAGSEVPIGTLAEIARDLASGDTTDIGWDAGSGRAGSGSSSPTATAGAAATAAATSDATGASMRDAMAHLEGTFIAALGHGDSRAAAAALIALDDTIEARIRAGEDSPDLDDATSTFRALIVRLAEAAGQGGDPRALVAPFVEALLALRGRAREAGDWASADLIRDALTGAGVEVRDGQAGSEWILGDGGAPGGPTAR